jgi:hypothetical protein
MVPIFSLQVVLIPVYVVNLGGIYYSYASLTVTIHVQLVV